MITNTYERDVTELFIKELCDADKNLASRDSITVATAERMQEEL